MEKEKLNPKSSDDEIENDNAIMPDDLFNTTEIVEGNHKKQKKLHTEVTITDIPKRKDIIKLE